VDLDGQRIDIRAGIHTLGGFSAHADQKDLLNFIGRMHTLPPRCAWCMATTRPSARWRLSCGGGMRGWRWWCLELVQILRPDFDTPSERPFTSSA
jgi:Cft2 family RNA processing exonuclease